MRIWSTAGEHLITLTSHLAAVNEIEFTPDGRTLLSLDDSGAVEVANLAARQALFELPLEGQPLKAMAISPDSRQLAAIRAARKGERDRDPRPAAPSIACKLPTDVALRRRAVDNSSLGHGATADWRWRGGHVKRVLGLPFIVWQLLAAIAIAAEPAAAPDAAGVEFFEKRIRPLLAENCHQCHGPKKQESGLVLTTAAAIQRAATAARSSRRAIRTPAC